MADQTLAEFGKTLAPQPPDKATVKDRRAVVNDVVKARTASGGLFESGSWTHGTSIAGKSDVDYMAYFLDDARPLRPSTALTNLKTALAGSHWSISGLRISSPTVKVQFYGAPHFEVVPAYHKGKQDGIDVFRIPGPNDEWVESVPVGHNAYVSKVNDDLNKKVKTLVRLIKAWKYNVGVPVSSFYLEMRTAKYASGESSIFYDIDLRAVMRRLINGEMKSMNDPLGIVPRIPATSSEANRKTALRQAEQALTWLEDADTALVKRDHSAYWSNMYRVFGSDYPYPTW